MPSQSLLCPVRVGRGTEMAALAGHLDQLGRTGEGRLVLLSGEAGVGKSRLVAEVVQTARDRGLVALVGQCMPDATVPYAPFVHAIRRGTRRLDRAELAAAFDGSAMLAAASTSASAGASPTSVRTVPADGCVRGTGSAVTVRTVAPGVSGLSPTPPPLD